MNRRHLLLLIALVLIVTAVVYALVTAGKTEGGASYRFAAVERGPIVATVTSTGTLNAVTTVEVGTQVSGTIAALYADFNTRVKAGQVVALIDPTFLHASVVDAQASLERARANTEAARRKLDRAKLLFSRNLIPQTELDDAQTNLQVSVAQEKQAQATLDRALINLRYATIRAPIDGVVINRNVDVGQTVAASFSAPTIFVIANDLAQMELQLSVDEADVGRVKDGQRVTFSVDAYPEQQFEGRVFQVRLFPQTVQNVVTYKIIVRVDNSDLKLRPGMTATATILVDRREDALKVPLSATRFVPPPDQLAALRAEMMKGAGGKASADTSRSWWSRIASLVKREAPPDTAQKRGQGARAGGWGGGSAAAGGGGWGSGGGTGGGTNGGWGSGGGSGSGGGGWGSGSGGSGGGSGSSGTGGWGSGGGGRGAGNTGGAGVQRVWIQAKDGRLRPVSVQLGIQDRTFAELVSGDLQEGDQIIVSVVGSAASPASQQNRSPFGGGGFGGGGVGGTRGGGGGGGGGVRR
ncbi:MAG: efflux RND transporter periplasmic adaptor subunit [Candidatus Latescibacteria bacterium]|nr:efflux RND transporter periplasmic adaptor subunit [Candidatus Latescibacterota bacterium]